MGKFRLEVTDIAKKQIEKHYKFGDKASVKRLDKILLELTNHPYVGVGNPEQLKHHLSGFWSRRLNQKDRLIYSVDENLVVVDVISAMGHYNDK